MLIVLSFLEQTAGYVSLDSDKPYESVHYELKWYFSGAVIGLIILAMLSACITRQYFLFFPVTCILTFQFIFVTGTLIYSLWTGGIDNPNQVVIGIEGFFEAQAQFYLLFLTPLRIADKYRATQEVTPAGTIISSNICIAGFACAYLRSIITSILRRYDWGD